MEYADLDVEFRHGVDAVKCYSPEDCREKLHSYAMPSLPQGMLKTVHEVCRRAAGILRSYGFDEVDARDLFAIALNVVRSVSASAKKRAEAVAYVYAYRRGFKLPLKGSHLLACGKIINKMQYISSAVSRLSAGDPLLYRLLSAVVSWMVRERKVSWGGTTIVRVACKIVALLFPNQYPYTRLVTLAGIPGRNSGISSYIAKLGVRVFTTLHSIPILVELPRDLCEYVSAVRVDLPQHVKCYYP